MASSKGYGQFCPVAKASEIVAERWTPLVLRELIAGSFRFNELRRGLPLMSPALLSQRLKELEFAGVVQRRLGAGRNTEYHLTQAGLELRPIIEALGFWGARWTRSHLTARDYDPSLLLWDMRRNIHAHDFPKGRRTVVQIQLGGAARPRRNWWLVIHAGEVDLCLKDPGYEVDLRVSAGLKTMVDVWMGRLPMLGAAQSGRLTFEGPRSLASSFRKSLRLSPFARTAG